MRFATIPSRIIRVLPIYLCLLGTLIACQPRAPEVDPPPNIVLIYVDDMGYGDLSCFGAEKIKTPHLDKLASEGKKLTSFYVASPVCSPSRAALMTGAYPLRVGIPHVLAPHGIYWAKERWRHGLHPDEATLPELLKQQGYATAIIGKWHLGHMPEHLPHHHGFDHFYGIPYSNDMRPETDSAYPPLPIIRDSVIIEENPDQSRFTARFTEEAIRYMDAQGENPFFVYLAQPMPHAPLYACDTCRGKSARGLYGDVIQEIDASVGSIVEFLEQKGLRENTIIAFTSDNGPALFYGNHSGSAGDLREGKRTTMEGGQRVPFILSWKGTVPSGVSDALVTNMDLMPTFLQWAGAPMPTKEIDGQAMTAFFEGEASESGREIFLYYRGLALEAMRSGKWKLHQPHRYQRVEVMGKDGKRGRYAWEEIDWALYDMAKDPGETENLIALYPELVDSLRGKMRAADSLLRTGLRKPFVYEGEAPAVGVFW